VIDAAARVGHRQQRLAVAGDGMIVQPFLAGLLLGQAGALGLVARDILVPPPGHRGIIAARDDQPVAASSSSPTVVANEALMIALPAAAKVSGSMVASSAALTMTLPVAERVKRAMAGNLSAVRNAFSTHWQGREDEPGSRSAGTGEGLLGDGC
jgi:hypothetical protein